MLRYLLLLSVLFATASAQAKEYLSLDPKRMLTVAETPAGKKYGLDLAYLDRMLNNLEAHARNYPPKFDNPQDRQRAVQDVKILSGMLDTLINPPAADPGLLARAAYLNSMGHNLDIAGSTEKTNSIFRRLLAAAPADPRGNYLYGTFLAGAGKPKEALPYLEKALAGGVIDAAYTIGVTYLALGEKARALENLEEYQRRKPSDENVGMIIEAIRNGKIEFRKSPG
jgi:tetratricopeptide (TPR) repeat protein